MRLVHVEGSDTNPGAGLVCERTGKLKYFSPQSAERRRKTIKKRRDERLSVYRCTHCRCWHLGHRAH